MEFFRAELKKIYPIANGAVLFLEAEDKLFTMVIGPSEGAAIMRELNDVKPPRPLTHELITNIMAGFDIELKQMVITDIVDEAFIATLILEQRIEDENFGSYRQEVHIDARPSDCIILALKHNKDIFVSRKVLERVSDVKSEKLLFFKLDPTLLGDEEDEEKPKITPDHLSEMDFDWKDLDLEEEGGGGSAFGGAAFFDEMLDDDEEDEERESGDED